MKKMYFASCALAALGIVCTTSSVASALEFLLAEWLRNGAAVASELSVAITGEILLEDTKGILGLKSKILCSGIIMGTLTTEGLGTANNVLSLSGAEVNNSALTEPALECANEENCPEPLVWPLHFPARGEVVLVVDGASTFFAVLGFSLGTGVPGFEITCMGSGITDECTAAESAVELALEGAALLVLGSEAFTELVGLKLGTCSLGGSESAVLEGEGVATLEAGGELSASSEGAEA